VVTPVSDEQLTLDVPPGGATGILSREVEPETLVECLRKVAAGEPWLESKAFLGDGSYPRHTLAPSGARPKVQLTPKETLIVSCYPGHEEQRNCGSRGATEQVVKNYLRKVYDKLGVADRLELALYLPEPSWSSTESSRLRFLPRLARLMRPSNASAATRRGGRWPVPVVVSCYGPAACPIQLRRKNFLKPYLLYFVFLLILVAFSVRLCHLRSCSPVHRMN